MRRSPAQSRPPSPYRLIWRGRLTTRPGSGRPPALLPRRASRSATGTTRTAFRPARGCALAGAATWSRRRGARRWSVAPAPSAPATRGPTPRSRPRFGSRAGRPTSSGSAARCVRRESRGRRRRGGRGPRRAQQRGGYVRSGPRSSLAAPTDRAAVGGPDLHPGSAGDAGARAARAELDDAAATRLVRVPAAAGAEALRAGRGTGSRSHRERRPEAAARTALALGRRPRARRLVGRRPRAARDLPRARRLGDRGHLGAGRLQPRARARGGAGGAAPRAASARPGSRSPGWSVRRRQPRLRRLRLDRPAARARCTAGDRRRRRGLRLARAAAGRGRLRAPRGDGLGRVRSVRRRARAWDRRPAHRADLVAVDLLRPGAGRDRAAARSCSAGRLGALAGAGRRPSSSPPGVLTSPPTPRSRWSRRRWPRRSS